MGILINARRLLALGCNLEILYDKQAVRKEDDSNYIAEAVHINTSAHFITAH